MKIALIDYGSGNLQSAYKALELAGKHRKSKIFITSKSKDLLKADKIVLPGFGTFFDCMRGLKSLSGMIDVLNEVVLKKKKPFSWPQRDRKWAIGDPRKHGNTYKTKDLNKKAVPFAMKFTETY